MCIRDRVWSSDVLGERVLNGVGGSLPHCQCLVWSSESEYLMELVARYLPVFNSQPTYRLPSDESRVIQSCVGYHSDESRVIQSRVGYHSHESRVIQSRAKVGLFVRGTRCFEEDWGKRKTENRQAEVTVVGEKCRNMILTYSSHEEFRTDLECQLSRPS